MFENLPWEKKEKIYITVLIISMTVNIISTACLIFAYRALTLSMEAMGI